VIAPGSGRGVALLAAGLLLSCAGVPTDEEPFRLSPACKAMALGDMDRAAQLVKEGESVNAGSGCALPLAAQRGDMALATLLLDRGADPNRRHLSAEGAATLGETPLKASVGSRKPEMVQLLLDRGARPREDYHAFALAIAYGDAATAGLLLERGADPNMKRPAGKVFAIDAAKAVEVPPRDLEPDRIDAAVKALQCKIEPLSDRQSLLYLAARGKTGPGPDGSVDIVKLLLGRGADPNARTLNGATPLMRAASQHQHDIMIALIDGGADKKVVDRCGRTAADYADLFSKHPLADQAPRTKAILEQRR
jgi:ankyrin repeat protein